MTKSELLQLLHDAVEAPDPEETHKRVDEALLEYINDAEITAAFNAVLKWYS